MRTTGTLAQLPVLVDFVQQWWKDTALPVAAAFPFEVALDEVFMNVIMHGTGGDEHRSDEHPRHERPRDVSVSLHHEAGEVTMVIEDDGIAFDPLSLSPPNVDAALEEREIGGLGVFLVRELMDVVSYARTGARNRLTMRKVVE
jgi:serine/threonine-protein kinase RsbW